MCLIIKPQGYVYVDILFLFKTIIIVKVFLFLFLIVYNVCMFMLLMYEKRKKSNWLKGKKFYKIYFFKFNTQKMR